MKKRKILIKFLPILALFFSFPSFAQTSTSNIYDSVFYQNLNDLNIPIGNILLKPTLTRYDFTRLLNAVECQDCVIPTEDMARIYNESFWNQFINLPGKYFSDINYLGGTYNGTNYYYCVAKIGKNDVMNGYPLGSSSCGGQFCGQRNVSKAEFFQTLSNLLMDRQMFNYSAPWGEIKEWFNNLKTSDFRHKYFNESQIDLIQSKGEELEGITTRLEYTTYLGYCTFNPENCGFRTFSTLAKNVWPLAEVNTLIRAGIIKDDDVTALSSPISPMDAVEKIQLVYSLHTKCEFDNDYDCDGISNHEDNCPYNYNPAQSDLDGDDVGDVCDEDIDGDGEKNPVGLVDDNGKINYGLLKKYSSDDKTPLGDQVDDTAFFIQITKLDQKFPTYVQFQIVGPEAPASVERDFGDLGTAKGRSVAHTYNSQGTYTITAKLTTQKRKEYIISSQIYFGTTTDTSYNLNIESATIDNTKKNASFQATYQGSFDYLQWENTAIGEPQKLKPGKVFTTELIEGERNNITVKGYVNDVLMAIATTDALDTNGKFYTFVPNYNPLLKSIGSKISTTLKLINISTSNISNIARDYGDLTAFFDSKLITYHTYTEQGRKILIQKLGLNNGQELIATSSLYIQDPSIVGNQTYNIIPDTSDKVKLSFQNLGLSLTNGDTITTTLNGQQSYTSNNVQDGASFLTIGNRLGVVKVNTKFTHGNLSLENKGIVTFGTKNQSGLRLADINEIFSGLHCDLDKDSIPDIYDDDIDGDGVPNLLGLILYEKEDCSFIVGDNIDETIYNQHFGICSLDNCPFRSNPNQADLNANGIGDICESEGDCGNGIIDAGEDCSSCPQDVGQCTAFCGNGIKEPAENCKNCPADIKSCPSLCGNFEIDEGEVCDNGTNNGTNNGKDGDCTIACTRFDKNNPNCGNGIIDNKETCITCPMDLGDICIQPGISSCGDGKIDAGETCMNCPEDVGECSATCGNGKQELGETCQNCSKDMNHCPSLCGNEETDSGEECDYGTQNGKNGKCGFDCLEIKNNPNCGNGIIDQGETCDTCPRDLQDLCVKPGGGICGNGILEEGETCTNCPTDAGPCTGFCGNGKIESSETCQNCPEDVGKCTGSIGNGILEDGEECDNGDKNGYDGLCSENGKNVDSKHYCGNGTREGNESCDLGASKNGTAGNICTKKCTIKTTDNPNCGNGVIDDGEKCDNCAVDLGSICLYTCGNDKVETGEECDNGDDNGKDGECTFNCKKQTNPNIYCGNGTTEKTNGEECDNGKESNGKDGKCDENCKKVTKAKCGDGIVQDGETCDLGGEQNGKAGSNCSSTCTEISSCPNGTIDQYENCQTCAEDAKDACVIPWTGECGNGIIEEGERCTTCSNDVGSCTAFCGNNIIEDAEDCSSCSADLGKCTGSCGNHILEPGEECDNGGFNGSDGACSKNCKNVSSTHYCGDGTQDENEACDDGIFNGTSKSKNNCSIMCTTINPFRPDCGNGIIDAGENCITCSVDLAGKCLATCGNGILEVGEECDHENLNGRDGECTFECKKQTNPTIYCGNGKIDQSGEQCDNGKENNGKDGKCDIYCKNISTPYCGNGIREADEQCDLGEKRNGAYGENCTKGCAEVGSCPNGKKDENEDCQSCSLDLGDICIGDGEATPICGNNIIESGEDCKSCSEDVGNCNAQCGNNVVEAAENCSNCSTDVGKCTGSCGNHIVEPGEQCDNGGLKNGYDGKCSFDCKNIDSGNYCGDGITGANEICDAGSKNGTLAGGCTLMCTRFDASKPNCGNGVVNVGENCDTCPVDLGKKCLVRCGNGELEIGEECDNGEENNGKDGECSFSCKKTKTKCGDHKKEGEEECDEGNANGTEGSTCSSECRNLIIPVCGDGIKSEGESCDLGTGANGNGTKNSICSKDCKEITSCTNDNIDIGEKCETCADDLGALCISDAVCGNGVPDEGEDCDEGVHQNGKGICGTDCKSTIKCGNGKVDDGETCLNCEEDLGACTATCGNGIVEEAEDCKNCPKDVGACRGSCGNGILETGETCDHGDQNGKDKKCNLKCELIKDTNKPYCGDGNTDTELGEKCDNGPNNGKSSCSFICTTMILGSKCGNGIIDAGENCLNCPTDLGSKCLTKCGNEEKESPWEGCDLGYWNGRTSECNTVCQTPKKTVCGNDIKEEGEACDHGTQNGKDKECTESCTIYDSEHPNCGNHKIEDDEDCMNCPTDVGLCTGSCGNHILEDGEECDHGSDNGKDNLCDENCRDISPDKKCGNGNPDEGEECDYGEYNGESECTLQCKFVKTINCGNGKIDEGENCNICAEDLGSKCLGKCGNNEIDTGEQCDNGEENNDTDGICTATCMDVTSCGNEQIDEGENCTNCSKDLKDRCVDNTDQEKLCGNGKIDEGENCTNCSKDVGECSASCGNEIHEEPEECDKGSANGTKGSMCSLNCKNTDPEHYCGNEITEKDLGEECDLGKERNGKEGSSCAIDCKPFDKENPKCGNGEIDEGERCDNCKKDLGDLCITKCGNGIKDFGEECDPKADNGEGIICSNECKIITGNDPDDYDCDGVPNDDDLCPYNAGIAGNEACLDPGHIRDPNDNGCKDPDDIDCDGIPNDDDLCPINPGYAGDNACLDPDHVRDPDDNGCKDPDDKDCDGVPNDEDSCSELAGIAGDEACTDPNHERDPDDHGCPNNDEDCDGISDNKDLCPNVPGKAGDKACTDPNHESDPDDNGCPDDDEDCDGIQDSIDNCPNIPGRAGDTACKDPNHKRELDDDGCPDLPDYLCEGDDCALVTVVCNSCPCQFADYNNTLQRDDSVRARLWDKKNMVHYKYSEFYSIGNLFN